jgi:hypothetical protein
VRFSRGAAGRAVHVLAEIGALIESGRFSLPVARTFPLAEVAEAHRVSEAVTSAGSSCCWSLPGFGLEDNGRLTAPARERFLLGSRNR